MSEEIVDNIIEELVKNKINHSQKDNNKINRQVQKITLIVMD